jgi:hypothetical protein
MVPAYLPPTAYPQLFHLLHREDSGPNFEEVIRVQQKSSRRREAKGKQKRILRHVTAGRSQTHYLEWFGPKQCDKKTPFVSDIP